MVKVSDPVQKGMLTFEKFVILMEEDLRTKQIQGHMLYDFFLFSLVLYLNVRLGLHLDPLDLSSIQEPIQVEHLSQMQILNLVKNL